MALELQCQFLILKSALTTTFLVKMPQNITKIAGYQYARGRKCWKNPPTFFRGEKTHFFGVGAPMPIFEPFMSSYNHIFDQNATKLHFLYTTKLVGYEYVKKKYWKNPPKFFRGEKNPFFWRWSSNANFWALYQLLQLYFWSKCHKIALRGFFQHFFLHIYIPLF